MSEYVLVKRELVEEALKELQKLKEDLRRLKSAVRLEEADGEVALNGPPSE